MKKNFKFIPRGLPRAQRAGGLSRGRAVLPLDQARGFTPRAQSKQFKGFTLTEVMVAVAIIAILTLLSITSYRSYIQKSRRTDAVNSLLSISLAEERYRSNNSSYGTLAQVWAGNTSSAGGYYTLAISNVSSTAYTITATGVGNQANDSTSGTSCSPMVFSVSSGTITKTPAVCWPP